MYVTKVVANAMDYARAAVAGAVYVVAMANHK